MRPWTSKQDVIKAVKTIATVFEQTQGKLPPSLVESYQKTIDAMLPNYPGLVRTFFEELTEKCPEAVKFFR